MSTRAEGLAGRIIECADGLAAYVQGLTDEQWRTVVKPDRRTVGVIVHHVASVYPIKIELATQIARGKAITGVTWDVVAEMNAQHAKENSAADRKGTLELLQRNSRVAADAVRVLTDEQLDKAVTVSLYGDAPLTTQFMIEDHAVRHSRHHLAKIQAALA
jgi:bifunctional N-acetylglucosamine-1-phosphate-uridyltransferase/glucosamine-1-phosphate-acetyltransferase GlmU-like protein